jgi:SAM-dependent methyltransferase
VASFKDLFSGHAAEYARFRPTYPPELFAWLAEASAGRGLAVDVGTGNGQAALGLAAHFEHVTGLDPSAEQIAQAHPDPKVDYRVAPAEATGLADASVDLLVAAQAFHWFDRGAFFGETARILRPGGVLALVSYVLSRISPPVDDLVHALYTSLDRYWEPERRLVEDGYASVAVPFDEIPSPTFTMHSTWTVEDLIGYLGTWSALRNAVESTGEHPLEAFTPRLAAAWGDAGPRDVVWPLAVRAFRVNATPVTA